LLVVEVPEAVELVVEVEQVNLSNQQNPIWLATIPIKLQLVLGEPHQTTGLPGMPVHLQVLIP
jgi:hypothetical protein